MTAAACLTSSFTVTPTTQHRHHHLCRPHSLSIRASSSPVAPPPQRSYTPPSPAENLNKYSSRIAQPESQGGSQAFLYGVGHSEDDMNKPQAGRAPVWYEGKTCNMHLLQLAEAVKEGLRDFASNTVGLNDAISMETRGMCYSLQSRDLIAESIVQWYR